MRTVNLFDIKSIYDMFSLEMSEKYIRVVTDNYMYKNRVTNETPFELNSLSKFVDYICLDYEILDNYYFSYEIKQISVEFDVLKISNNSVLNIELKTNCTREKMERQLKQKYHYLQSLKRNNYYIYSYNCEDNGLFKLDVEEYTLIEMDVNEIRNVMIQLSEEKINYKTIEELFDIKNYLVSPIEDDNKNFVDNNYFLTADQEKKKKEIVKIIKQNDVFDMLSICAYAGTGKTLLVYDIAKSLMESGYNVLLIHCGSKLSVGQRKLKEKNWEIVCPKDIDAIDIGAFNIIIIDEAHRIYTKQLKEAVEKSENIGIKLLFSFDDAQVMDNKEMFRINYDTYFSKVEKSKKFSLGKRIRTNPEIAKFITLIFDIKFKRIDNIDIENFNNINLKYCDTYESLEVLLDFYDTNDDYQIIRYTPPVKHYHRGKWSKYDNLEYGKTTHETVGLEFDNVVTFLTDIFVVNGKQISSKTGSRADYDYNRMFYNMITRTRKTLTILVVNNKPVFEFLVEKLDCLKNQF